MLTLIRFGAPFAKEVLNGEEISVVGFLDRKIQSLLDDSAQTVDMNAHLAEADFQDWVLFPSCVNKGK